MTLFAIFATILLLVVSAIILPPLWRGLRANDAPANRKATNLAIFRDQLTELEREKNEGTLAESDLNPPNANCSVVCLKRLNLKA
jgi:cytochrome c-type biogenesis protein CcmH